MPDISISAEQEAYIEALREQLDDEVAYGHVRRQDAVQYLIDHHREDGDLDISVGSVEEATDASEGGADADGSGGDEGTGDPSTGPGGETGSATVSRADAEGSSVEGTVAALSATGPGGSADEGSAASDAGDGGEGETTASGGETATIGSAQSEKVQRMMNLMDAHSDVWAETDSSEGKYRVELPDGSAENVATKDDVRALLFKHYR